MAEDLWPDFEAQKIISPKTILHEQSSILTTKTKNVLASEVISGVTTKGLAVHQLRILAPALNNYKYNLLQLTHDPIFFYPCQITGNSTMYEAQNEEQLFEVLRKIFNSDETKKIVTSLYSQSLAE